MAAVIQHIFDDEESPSAVPSLTPLQKIKKEINTYMEYPSLEADADPLAWWKAESGRFPNLAYLGRKYLCICGTSVEYSAVQGISQTAYEIIYYLRMSVN